MKKVVFFSLVVILSGSLYAQFDSLGVRFVGNWPFGSGSAVAYDESRDLVFFGSGGGVYVLDAMVPDNPTKSSEALHTQGVVTGLFYDTLDERLYIAAEKAGFEIWDVSDIINPKKLGCCYIAVDVLDVFVSDHFAYVTNGEDYGIAPGISIWDVSDPSDPEYVGFFYFVRDYDVYVSGSYAYVVGEYDFRVIDVSNPWEPQEIGSCPIPGRIVSVSGSYAYVIDYYGLRIIDVSTPSNPLIVASLDLTDARDLYVSGTYAYVISPRCCILIIDVSTPSDPQFLGHCSISSDGLDICVSDSYAYVSCFDAVRVVNVYDPSSPFEEGCFDDVPNYALDVCVSGSYAFVADGNAGLRVIDVFSSSSPIEVACCSIPGNAWAVSLSGDYVYAASGDDEIRIINVSNPLNPQEVGYHSLVEQITDVYATDSYLYVTDVEGLHILDISIPSSPQEVGKYQTPDQITDVYVSDSHAYTLDSNLRVIDVSTPSNPQEVGYCETDGSDIYVSGSNAYVTAGEDGLRIIDVSDPSDPQEVSCYDTPGYAHIVSGSGSYVNLIDWGRVDSSGYRWAFPALWVLDISTPETPEKIGYYITPSSGIGICTADSFIYIAAGDAGLQIYENLLWEGIEEEPINTDSPLLLTVSLNRLSYDVPGQAFLTLYSSDGRRVLEETIQGKGTWTPSSQPSSHLPAGVYFARVENNSASARAKLVILH